MPRTLVEVLIERAAARPTDCAYQYLASGSDLELDTFSYADLDRRARAIAAELQRSLDPQSRVLLLFEPEFEFAAAFFGCLYAGHIAVPAYPPDPRRLERTLPRLRAVMRDADVQAIASSGRLAVAARHWLGDDHDALWLDTASLPTSTAGDWQAPPLESDSIALLQYTSGSTSSPKGVILRHENLLANLDAITQHLGLGTQSRGVSWLPPYHDMGLIGGLLQPIYAGFPAVQMSPLAFLEKPLRWLQLLSSTRATVSAAPNFAFDLAVRRTTERERADLDLSAWEVALCGSEPIDPGTLGRFARAFAAGGLRAEVFMAAYGLAEATLLVSAGARLAPTPTLHVSRDELERGHAVETAEGNRARAMVSCGRPAAGMELAIVDPETRRALPEAATGEIWIGGPCVATGYWHDDPETQRTFRARIEGGAGGTYLRSGDLGFLRDGELFVTGRIKDLIVIRGRNIHPEDVELAVVAAHACNRRGAGAAFSIRDDGGERLIVVQEVSDPTADLDEVVAEIRHRIAAEFQVACHAVVLIERGSIAKTSSGKIQRHAVRQAFGNDALSVLCEWRDQRSHDRTTSVSGSGAGCARPAAEASAEAIAIVGMSCRLPGADDPEGLWNVLRDGRDAVREIPADRWDADAYYDPEPGTPGHMNTRRGGFLEGIDLFDPMFFGISPREAAWMDPQQRLITEVVWEACEDAGHPAEALGGTRTAVFVGVGGTDYAMLFRQQNRLDLLTPYAGTGNAHSIVANRLSYLFDLRGPSVAVDTACSSSLVALHLACQSLRTGEAELAVAGGVNVILIPDVSIAFAQARMLAGDGRCKSFDAGADGYVRSEGAAAVLLKPMSTALSDGDRILGVIRASGTNQDGRTPGIAVPNPEAQQALIERVLAQAGLSADEIGYVEAHGTGTAIGDPAEVAALTAAFRHRQPELGRCLLGSVKANIGHAETAAGLAGLVKLLLCLERQQIPQQIHLNEPNPKLSIETSPFEIPRQAVPWPRGERPRIATISSFGFGGTNAHAVLEEPPRQPARRAVVERSHHVFSLSARSADGLAAQAGRLLARLENESDADLADLCHSANIGRTRFAERAAITCASLEELRAGLADLAADTRNPSLQRGQAVGDAPRVAFLFTGQGSQYVGMGRSLYRGEPVFRQALDSCAEVADGFLDCPLLSLLFDEQGGDERLARTLYTQPALFSLEFSLCALWRSWGIEPDAVLGHSLGEFAAACVAGCVSLKDALMLVGERARLMDGLPAGGAMLAVRAREEQVQPWLAARAGRVAIGAINGPESLTLSGPRDDIEAIARQLAADGIEAKPLRVSHAFHSSLIDPMLGALEDFAESIPVRPPRVPFVSNVSGDFLSGAPDAAYWRSQAASTVRFAAGVERLVEAGCTLFLEVGPHPSSIAMARACAPGTGHVWVPSLRRGADDGKTIADALARLSTVGCPIDWKAVDCDRARRRRYLPLAPYERQRFWLHEDDREGKSAFEADSQRLALIGRRLRSALDVAQFESQLSAIRSPFLADHRVHGSAVVPAAFLLALAWEGAEALFAATSAELANLSFSQVLFLPEQKTQLLQLAVDPPVAGEASFRVHAQPAGAAVDRDAAAPRWNEHASGVIRTLANDPTAVPADALEQIRARCTDERPVEGFYAALAERGLEYGPAFQGIEALWSGDREALARVRAPEGLDAQAPAASVPLLDACFQAIAACLPVELASSLQGAFVPFQVERFRAWGPLGRQLYSHCRLRDDSAPGELLADVTIFDDAGALLGELQGLRLVHFGSREREADDPETLLYRLRWQETTPPPVLDDDLAGSRWLVLADRGGIAEGLGAQLEERGAHVMRLQAPAAAEGSALALEAALTHRFADAPATRRDHVVHCWGLDAPSAAHWHEPGRLAEAEEATAGSLLELTRALLRCGGSELPRLSIVTRGLYDDGGTSADALPQALLDGFARSLALEYPKLGARRVDLPATPCPDERERLLRCLLSDNREDLLRLRPEGECVARLVRSAEVESDGAADARAAVPDGGCFELVSHGQGRLERLAYRPSARRPPPPGAVEIAVEASGLNFRDVLNAMGLYPGDPIPYGGECSGRICSLGADVEGFAVGDAVLALAPGSFASHVVTSAALVAPIPSGMGFAEAAAMPIAFLTADYALNEVARIAAGETVLIHAAAGGVGMAALQIARRAGAQPLATAGTPEKRAFLHELGIEHVFDSRSLEFSDAALAATQGRGVDVVLNSLPGAFIAKGLACLAPFGRFVEIGRTDIYQNRQIGLLPFRNNLAYTAIDLEKVCRERPEVIRRRLAALLAAFEAGELQPPRHALHEPEDVVEAFRSMAQRQNIGKLVVSMRSQQTAASRAAVRADASYLVTGGVGGIGSKLAEWLLDQGARHLVLCSRHAEDCEAVSKLRARASELRVERVDVCDAEALGELLQRVRREMPPLRGVFHAAGVLDDALVHDTTREQLGRVLAPKLRGAWELHAATADDELDLFVLFSSAAALLGSPGQACYSAANAFLDALARHRRAQGLAGVAIEWGPWADVGMAARGEIARDLAARGMLPLSPAHALGALERVLASDADQVLAADVDWLALAQALGADRHGPLLENLAPRSSAPCSVDAPGGIRAAAILALPPDERIPMLVTHIRGELAQVMALVPSELAVDVSLQDLGLDSLMALELKEALEQGLQIELGLEHLVEEPSIERLAKILLRDMEARRAD